MTRQSSPRQMRPPESAFDHLRRLNDARVIGSPRPGPIRGEKLSNLALSLSLSLILSIYHVWIFSSGNEARICWHLLETWNCNSNRVRGVISRDASGWGVTYALEVYRRTCRRAVGRTEPGRVREVVIGVPSRDLFPFEGLLLSY